MIMLVSALMCAHRKRPPSDAGGVQLSNLVASMGQHLIPARSSREMGPPKTTTSNCSHTTGQMGGMGLYAGGGEVLGDVPTAFRFHPSSADL